MKKIQIFVSFPNGIFNDFFFEILSWKVYLSWLLKSWIWFPLEVIQLIVSKFYNTII